MDKIISFVKSILLKIFMFLSSIYIFITELFKTTGFNYESIWEWDDKNSVFKNISSDFFLSGLIWLNGQRNDTLLDVRYSIDGIPYRRIVQGDKLTNPIWVDKNVKNETKILSAFSDTKDITALVREYAGPDNDFYGGSLQLKHMGVKKLYVMNNKLEEFEFTNPDEFISHKLKYN